MEFPNAPSANNFPDFQTVGGDGVAVRILLRWLLQSLRCDVMMARTRMVTVETEITGWILNLGSRGLGSHVGHVGERMMPSLCLEQLRGPVDCYGKVWRKIEDGQTNQQIHLGCIEVPVREQNGHVQYVLNL